MNDILRQFGRTIARSFDFATRASRREFAIFVLVAQVPLAVVHWALAWFAADDTARLGNLAVEILLVVPLFALAVRRMHDIGRSGWWSAPLLALVTRMVVLDLLALPGDDIRRTVEMASSYVDWLLTIPATLVALALAGWPGTRAADRFGSGVTADTAPPETKPPEMKMAGPENPGPATSNSL